MFGLAPDKIQEFIVAIISGLIVAGLIASANKIVDWINIKTSKYSGKWWQYIYDNFEYEGEPIKTDIYHIKHRKAKYTGKLTVNITGTIKRVKPESHNHRKWDIIGYLDGDVLTIIYQSYEGQKSRGCIYVRLYGDFEFRGFYLEEHKDGTIEKLPLIIKKMKDD